MADDRSIIDMLLAAEALDKGVVADPATAGPQAVRLVGQARAAGAAEALVVALGAAAWAEHARLRNDPARALLDEAVRRAARPGLRHRLPDLLVRRAAVLHELGRLTAARRDLDRAAGLAASRRRAEIGLQRAALLQNAGALPAAATAYAAVRADPAAPAAVRVKALNNLAILEARRGRPGVALALADEAAAGAAPLGPALVAYVAQTRAWATLQAGQLAESLRRFAESAVLYAAAGLPLGEHHLEYADALLDLRLVDEAREAAQRAAREFETVGASLMAAEAQLRLARLALLAAEPAVAVEAARRAADLARTQHRPAWVAEASVVGVAAHLALGDAGEADLRRAVRYASTLERHGLAPAAVEAYLAAGQVAARLGRRRPADRTLRRAAALARGQPVLVRVRGQVAAATAATLAGDDVATLRACRGGLADLARHRRALPSLELRALASGHGAELGRLGLAALLPTGSGARVLEWLERTRAAALLTVDAPPGDEATGAGASPVTAVPVRELRAALDGRVLVAYGALDGALFATVLTARRTRLVPLGRVDEAVQAGETALFALRRLARPSPLPAVVGATRAAADAALAQLRRLLVEPLRLAADVPVVVAPEPRLTGVPWSPLHRGPVGVTPSGAVWARTAASRAATTGSAVLVAGPELPGAVTEVAALAPLHPAARVLAPPASTAEAVTAALRGTDLAHLACHGHFRPDSPTFSALALSDRTLTVHELALKGAAPRRAVLAACEVGAQRSYAGDEVLGFVTALMAAGTAGVVASGVLVPDAATVPLMCRLHERLVRGATLADALHGARAGVDLDDPTGFATWCAFTAYGAA